MPRQSHTSIRWIITTMIPVLFVFLWSTGFIGSKIVVQHSPPLTFLFIRMLMAALVLAPVLFLVHSSWPGKLSLYLHSLIIGALVHGIYLGGVFWAISIGTEAGISALIVGLQPLLTLFLATAFLNEKLSPGKIAGMVIGFIGLTMVIGDRIELNQLPLAGLLLCIGSLLAISVGTVYQKRISHQIELLPAVFLQYLGAAIVLLPFALLYETMTIEWNTEFILASFWLVFVLSIGAVLLLMHLIRSENAGNVASLFYLVPPLTALEAYLLFSERLTYLSIAGMLISVTGVALVLRQS